MWNNEDKGSVRTSLVHQLTETISKMNRIRVFEFWKNRFRCQKKASPREGGSSTFRAVACRYPVDVHPSAHLPHRDLPGRGLRGFRAWVACGRLCMFMAVAAREEVWPRGPDSGAVDPLWAHLLPAAARPALGSAPWAWDRPAGASVWEVTRLEKCDGSVCTDMRYFLS